MIKSIFINKARSLTELEYDFTSGINVISGPNGCGKTTVLELVYLLTQGFSFRTKDLKEVIAWNENEMLLRGTFEKKDTLINRGLQVNRLKLQAKENGELLRCPTNFFGKIPAVIMQPSDIELLRGAPEVRRSWLDEILCFQSASNANILRNYKRVLKQRNQWLRQFKQNGIATGGEDLFVVLTQQIAELAAKLWIARINLTQKISPVITNYYGVLSSGIDEITCQYKSSIFNDLEVFDEELLKNTYAKKLKNHEAVEKMQGLTMIGPHKDDLSICASGYEMRSVGSQGQCRSAAVAMRFAAVDVASQNLSNPILLLDDIFAELDVNRRDAVANLIREKKCQVLIATPQSEELPFKADAEFKMNF